MKCLEYLEAYREVKQKEIEEIIVHEKWKRIEYMK